MTSSKQKSLKPKEVSLDPSIKALLNSQMMKAICLMKKMMLEHLPSQTSHYPVRMREKKSSPTMSGNMPLMSYSNCPHSILKGKVLENGSSIKIWKLWSNLSKWNENDITIGAPHTSYLENSWDKSNLEFLKTNSIRNLHMLWKYWHHLVRKQRNHQHLEIHSLLC